MRLFQKLFLIIFLLIFSCASEDKKEDTPRPIQFIKILGIAQDAGYPQIDCEKSCCQAYYDGLESKKRVSSLGLVDLENNQKWLFDATPDIAQQVQDLKKELNSSKLIDGIFLTHAHIGHYTGLMHLGREALGGKSIPVHVMPKMKTFLEQNGPWSQLVSLKNIQLKLLKQDTSCVLNNNLSVIPFLVPHRDEFSETVGYKIQGPNKSALFIPDINKWQLWEKNIVDEVKKVDYAFLDATFFKDGEIPRPMSEVPHPFIEETVRLLQNESRETKNKVYFIHFNHSNPAILDTHSLQDSIQKLGFKFAKQGMNFPL